MKTITEMLNFYGIKLDTIYSIKNSNKDGTKKGYFRITMDSTNEPIIFYSKHLKVIKEKNNGVLYNLLMLNNWNYQEYKEPILDTKEKEYLNNIIRPFKDRVEEITKVKGLSKNEGYNYISIKVRALNGVDEYIHLPLFKTGTMYKGLEEDKSYTTQELLLWR